MNAKRIAGIVLILVGAVALYLREFSYRTKEDVVKVGPLEAKMETEKRIPIHPALSGLVVVAGIALLVIGGKKQ